MYSIPASAPLNHRENYFSSPYYLWKKCGDDEIARKFMIVGESLAALDATLVGNVVRKDIRISTVSWIKHNNDSKELYDFLIDKITRINNDHYGMKLDSVEDFQYTRYSIGGHYTFHNDIIPKKENSMRKLSVVMALTSADTYQGGDFLLSPTGGTPQSIRLDKGDILAFPSYVPHTVTPVTVGNRVTVVCWASGPKFV
jgi:PKHD-type hydroxylase